MGGGIQPFKKNKIIKFSDEYNDLVRCEDALKESVKKSIKNLYWKDFEILVDLLFTQGGWRRISRRGETMKSIDMELEDPITKDKYLIQIKISIEFKRIQVVY